MKQIEITTNVLQSLQEVDQVLTHQGFNIIRKSRVEDQYMCMGNDPITEEEILPALSHSLLIRYLQVEGQEPSKRLTYKNKVYDGDTVLSEEKIVVRIDSRENCARLLESLGFHKMVDVRYNVVVYAKDGLEFCFQEVENLGLLVEVENLKDFEGATKEEILEEKNRMLQELRDYNLEVSNDYDVKKAYQLIKNRIEGK